MTEEKNYTISPEFKPQSIEFRPWRILIQLPEKDIETAVHEIILSYAAFNEKTLGTPAEQTIKRLTQKFYSTSGPTPYQIFKQTGELSEWTEGRFRISIENANHNNPEHNLKVLNLVDNGQSTQVNTNRVLNWIPQNWLSGLEKDS